MDLHLRPPNPRSPAPIRVPPASPAMGHTPYGTRCIPLGMRAVGLAGLTLCWVVSDEGSCPPRQWPGPPIPRGQTGTCWHVQYPPPPLPGRRTLSLWRSRVDMGGETATTFNMRHNTNRFLYAQISAEVQNPGLDKGHWLRAAALQVLRPSDKMEDTTGRCSEIG